MSVPIYHLQIGDGSEYQEKQPDLPDISADLTAWRRAYHNNRLPLQAGSCGSAHTSVLWDDGEMYVRLELEGTPVGEEKPQPPIVVGICVHEWESLVAQIASKRRELELRTFPGDEDETEEVM